MPIYNSNIAEIFDEIADYLEIAGDNPFKIRAYRNASRTIRELGVELQDMAANEEEFTTLQGIGKELAAKISEILETGTVRALQKLQARIPGDVRQLLRLPNLGPKRVGVLYHDLNIRNLDQLKAAAEEGRISHCPVLAEKLKSKFCRL